MATDLWACEDTSMAVLTQFNGWAMELNFALSIETDHTLRV